VRVHAVAGRFYKYALALPVWTLLVANLDRFIANEAHSFARLAWFDLTKVFAKVEGPLIASLQHAFGGSAVGTFASTFDSIVWPAPVALAGGLLVAADRGRALNSLIVVYVLAGLLAVPLFAVLPAFEPWTTNATYGADALTNIRYLYANASVSTLTRINTDFTPPLPALRFRVCASRFSSWARWCSATPLPHGVTHPVRIGRDDRAGRRVPRPPAGLDSLAAIPFSLAVVALGKRLPLDLNLRLQKHGSSCSAP
jgi:hypothetical protein